MTAPDKLYQLCRSALEEIDLQLERKRALVTTITNLEAFRLEAQDQNSGDITWNAKFYELWVVLEVTYAVASANKQQWLSSEQVDRIDDALMEMRRMVEEKIARLEHVQARPGEDRLDQ
jgi:hypothetical protein